MSTNASIFASYRARDEKRLNSRKKSDTWTSNQVAELVVDEGILRIFQCVDTTAVRRVFWLCDAETMVINDVLISMLPVGMAKLDFPTGYQVWGSEVMFSPKRGRGYLVESIPNSAAAIDIYPAMVMPLPSFART